MIYRIREVDTADEEIADLIKELHDDCFANTAPRPNLDRGYWWLAHSIDGGREVVGFCGLTHSYADASLGYLKRAGVLRRHRGQGLQRRFIRVREAKARKVGMRSIITDTSDNPASANSLINCGYRMFQPENPWGFRWTCYWIKDL